MAIRRRSSRRTLRKQFPRQRLTTAAAQDYLDRLRRSGGTLGRRTEDGNSKSTTRTWFWVLQASAQAFYQGVIAPNLSSGTREIFEKSGIAVSDHVPVGAPVTGSLTMSRGVTNRSGIPKRGP